jgi:hypothetical protein
MPRPLTSCKWCGAGSAKFLRDDSTGQTVGQPSIFCAHRLTPRAFEYLHVTCAQVCGECYTVLAVFREDMTENGEAPVFQEDDQGKQRTGYIAAMCAA